MDHRVVCQNGYHAPTHSHSTSQLLVADDAMPLICDDDMAVPTALTSRLAVSQL